jgi:hypothetical protein
MTIHPGALIGAIDTIEAAVQKLQGHFRPPALVELADGVPMFRHEQYDDLLMSQLKCVRCVSLLRAGTLLLLNGFYQEVGVLCRCLIESVEDVMFLATPLGEGNRPSKAQAQLVAEFFQEEFEDPSKPMGSQNKRVRVSRDEVLAGIARIAGNPLNPSDGKALTRGLHLGYSGYVHGAYPHLMELFGAPLGENGRPDAANGRYYMGGHMPFSRCAEMTDTLTGRAHNTAVAVSLVAKRLNEAATVDMLTPIIDLLAKATESDQIGDINRAVKDLKRGKPLSG